MAGNYPKKLAEEVALVGWYSNSPQSLNLVTGRLHKSEGAGALSCGIFPSIAAVVKTWVPGAVVVDLCFVRCALRCVALYDASRKISVMPDGPRQIALLGCVSYGYCRVLVCCLVQ